MKRAALLSALLLVNACTCGGDPPPVTPGGPDGGTVATRDDGDDAGTDGGAPSDGGLDAGPSSDGGTGDAGTQGDGGSEDAGTPPDGGQDCALSEPRAHTALASTLNNPRRLAADEENLYVTESASLNPNQTEGRGRLLRIPRAGGAAVEVAGGLLAPDALAVDATHAFVLDRNGLWRIDKATGQRGTLPIDGTLNNVILGDTEVLLSGNTVVVATGLERLVRLGKDGSNRFELYKGPAGSQVRGARLVGGDVWFLVTSSAPNTAGLYRVPLNAIDSVSAERVDASVTSGQSLEVTPTHFLIAEGSEGTGRVLMLPREGGAPLVLAEGLQGPSHPVQVGDTVYFKDATPSGAGPSFFRHVRTCAPGTVATVGPSGAGPGELLLDGTTLRFTSQESGSGGYVGSIP
ncbi:signal integration modulator SinM [Myxococcaceae bacterium GXIMD 01537]